MLSKRLKAYRVQCGLTQKQVSNILEIDRSSYTYYELGKSLPTIETLIKLAKIFRISVDELVGNDADLAAAAGFSDTASTYSSGAQEPDYFEKLAMVSRDEQELLLEYRVLSEQSKREIRRVALELARADIDV